MLFDIGYGFAAFGYLILVFLLFTVRKAGLAKHLLMASTLVTFMWSVAHLNALGWISDLNQYVQLDSFRLWIWALFLSACLQNQFSSFWQLLSRPLTLIILILPTLSVVFSLIHVVSDSLVYLIFTLVTIQTLVLLEQVFRQSAKQKWEYKPLIIYLGALTTFDFFTYANAAMVSNLNPSFFAARGFIFLALLPFLVLAIRRIQHWGIEIFVSREVVMHSTLLMLSGAYLLVMALLGYIVKYFGGNWSTPIQIALFLIAIVLLLSLFLSNEFRTKLKIFITKNFYANQFDYRVEWVALTKTLSANTKNVHEVYQTALQAWMQGIKYEQGMLIKTLGEKSICVANQNCESKDFKQKSARDLFNIKNFLQEKQWIVDFDEMKIKPELYEDLVNRNHLMKSFGFQLIIPIFKDKTLWGYVLLNSDQAEKRMLNWELRDYLTAVTDQTSNYIFQAESSQALAENAQFAAFSRMSAFVVHDLKNVLAQINLLLANAKQHKSNPEFIDDTFETLEHTKARMDKMLKQLMDKSIDKNSQRGDTDLLVLINDVIDNKCKTLLPLPKFEYSGSVTASVNEDKFANVLYHLISNAQQATEDNGEVLIKLYENESEVIIDISDTGSGMQQKFIEEKLFTPFETTKGNAGMGIGAYDAKTYLESLGGSINVTSTLGEGSLFKLSIPK